MGVLVMLASALLTILSIHNMTNNFVIPLTKPSVSIDEFNSSGEGGISFSGDPADLSGGIYYSPEINIAAARQSFSVLSYFYLAIVVVGGMVAAYYLAGRAMHPISMLNREIGALDGKSLSKRLDVPHTKDEIENLTRSFNELFARLEQEFERERRFSSNAAHELKTPLATIQTSAQVLMLGGEVTEEEYRENLNITIQSVRRLSQVLDGLLLLGKQDVEIAFESVNIPETLHGIAKELAPCYCEKNIALIYDLQADVLTGNPLLLYRAFFNLIENAYKYTERDGAITISSHYSGGKITIRIADTGIGIPENDIPHIFEPFYRADKSRSRKTAGAGLGLCIAKEIFDLHKATISATNLKTGGTMVEVEF